MNSISDKKRKRESKQPPLFCLCTSLGCVQLNCDLCTCGQHTNNFKLDFTNSGFGNFNSSL